MIDLKDIKNVVAEVVQPMILAEEKFNINWAIHQVRSVYGDVAGGNSEFYEFCADRCLKDLVKDAVGKYKPKNDSNQREFDSFKHFMEGYTFSEDGELVWIPTEQITLEQWRMRLEQWDKNAQGQIEHSDEARMFVEHKFGVLIPRFEYELDKASSCG